MGLSSRWWAVPVKCRHARVLINGGYYIIALFSRNPLVECQGPGADSCGLHPSLSAYQLCDLGSLNLTKLQFLPLGMEMIIPMRCFLG